MHVRFRFKTAALAEEAALKLPVACNWQLLRDQTSDAYLEFSDKYEEYFEKYIYTPYSKQ